MVQHLEQPELGGRVRALRSERSWDQEPLAEALDLQQSDISKIENGTRKISSVELVKLARLFGITAEELITVPDETEVLFRIGDGTSIGTQSAVDLVRAVADDLAHLRALIA